MNPSLLAALCLLGSWAALAGGVTVQDGKFSFSLESVKKLKDLGDFRQPSRRNSGVAPTPCNYPNFPKELRPLCTERNAREVLQRLEAIAEDPSLCEICAYAACTGC
ncbi:guanylin [Sturnira hondurensis]|uniref:guanylin n=1 Tax=Sturnira hondurensis TaxID=192404 RepID=UPI0018793FEF|nr:guanylin [Sturnira hondurensis]